MVPWMVSVLSENGVTDVARREVIGCCADRRNTGTAVHVWKLDTGFDSTHTFLNIVVAVAERGTRHD